ncbi:hypothetical protein [Rhodococcus sp. ACT016]|uniref:hypothetical protein n=1 Tax=Rhodococcus sp. ACT016 TaxID=3134808 RepID=UPI003D277BD0
MLEEPCTDDRCAGKGIPGRAWVLPIVAAAVIPGAVAAAVGYGLPGAVAATALTGGCIGLAAALLRDH